MIKKLSILALAATYLTACTTTDPYTGEQKTSNLAGGAVLGAALGAVGGAVIGGGGRDSRNGALIGAGIGALSPWKKSCASPSAKAAAPSAPASSPRLLNNNRARGRKLPTKQSGANGAQARFAHGAGIVASIIE